MKIDQALRQAKKAKANGQLTDAREIYQQILTKFPKTPRHVQGWRNWARQIRQIQQPFNN